MRVYLLIVVVAVVTMLGFTTQAQSFDEQVNQTLKEYLSEYPEKTQFSVAVLDSSQTLFYGQVKFSDTINAFDNSSSVFQIGSVTKVLTSTLLAKLILEKKLKLTDSLQKFFDFELNEPSITLEALSNHTSGLPRLPDNLYLGSVDAKNPYKDYTQADLDYYLESEMSVAKKDKASYQYSNLGAGILALALENATGQSYAELLSEKIFQPLDMKQSTLETSKILKDLVQGLDQSGNITPTWDMGPLSGAGAVLSSTKDLSKFVRAHFEEAENAFSVTTMPTFTVNSKLRIGLGWHILQGEDGHDVYWHNGGTGGYSSSLFMVPESQKAIIILSNVSAFHPKTQKLDELGFELLSLF